MANIFSNMAINPIPGFKNLGKDLASTVTEQVPLTHAFRTYQGQQQFASHMANGGVAKDFSYGAGTLNKKRIAGAAIGGYVGADALYRTVSGGSAYRNNTGEKDIVGVPFF